MTPEEFAKQLFTDLPSEREERVTSFCSRVDKYRNALRQEMQKMIREYVKDYNPKTRKERQHSVDLINGVVERLGFCLEHPKHPGKPCYLSLVVGKSNARGQIRLVPKGECHPVQISAYLSQFANLQVMDPQPTIEPKVENIPNQLPWAARTRPLDRDHIPGLQNDEPSR